MRTTIAIVTALCLTACGDSEGDDGDDTPTIDAPMGTADMNPGTPATCASYCTTIQANCTAANEQFSSPAECMASCTTWEQGALGAQAGNSLECRGYHATAAGASPAIHCTHAGPGGDALCGTNCEGFCTLVLGVCIGANEQYGGDMGACMTACEMFTTDPYSTADTAGDTLSCRLYHATAASTNPGLHCDHTAAVSATCN